MTNSTILTTINGRCSSHTDSETVFVKEKNPQQWNQKQQQQHMEIGERDKYLPLKTTVNGRHHRTLTPLSPHSVSPRSKHLQAKANVSEFCRHQQSPTTPTKGEKKTSLKPFVIRELDLDSIDTTSTTVSSSDSIDSCNTVSDSGLCLRTYCTSLLENSTKEVVNQSSTNSPIPVRRRSKSWKPVSSAGYLSLSNSPTKGLLPSPSKNTIVNSPSNRIMNSPTKSTFGSPLSKVSYVKLDSNVEQGDDEKHSKKNDSILAAVTPLPLSCDNANSKTSTIITGNVASQDSTTLVLSPTRKNQGNSSNSSILKSPGNRRYGSCGERNSDISSGNASKNMDGSLTLLELTSSNDQCHTDNDAGRSSGHLKTSTSASPTSKRRAKSITRESLSSNTEQGVLSSRTEQGVDKTTTTSDKENKKSTEQQDEALTTNIPVNKLLIPKVWKPMDRENTVDRMDATKKQEKLPEFKSINDIKSSLIGNLSSHKSDHIATAGAIKYGRRFSMEDSSVRERKANEAISGTSNDGVSSPLYKWKKPIEGRRVTTPTTTTLNSPPSVSPIRINLSINAVASPAAPTVFVNYKDQLNGTTQTATASTGTTDDAVTSATQKSPTTTVRARIGKLLSTDPTITNENSRLNKTTVNGRLVCVDKESTIDSNRMNTAAAETSTHTKPKQVDASKRLNSFGIKDSLHHRRLIGSDRAKAPSNFEKTRVLRNDCVATSERICPNELSLHDLEVEDLDDSIASMEESFSECHEDQQTMFNSSSSSLNQKNSPKKKWSLENSLSFINVGFSKGRHKPSEVVIKGEESSSEVKSSLPLRSWHSRRNQRVSLEYSQLSDCDECSVSSSSSWTSETKQSKQQNADFQEFQRKNTPQDISVPSPCHNKKTVVSMNRNDIKSKISLDQDDILNSSLDDLLCPMEETSKTRECNSNKAVGGDQRDNKCRRKEDFDGKSFMESKSMKSKACPRVELLDRSSMHERRLSKKHLFSSEHRRSLSRCPTGLQDLVLSKSMHKEKTREQKIETKHHDLKERKIETKRDSKLKAALARREAALKKKAALKEKGSLKVAICVDKNTPVDVTHLNDYTRDEIAKAWWSKTDYTEIKVEYEAVIFMIENNKPIDEKLYCARGLEKRTEDGAWEMYERHRDSINAVLDVQDKLKLSKAQDPIAIAKSYEESNQKSYAEALKRGRQDAKEARRASKGLLDRVASKKDKVNSTSGDTSKHKSNKNTKALLGNKMMDASNVNEKSKSGLPGQKCVHFAGAEQVCEIPSLLSIPKEEHESLWFTTREKEEMETECQRVLKLIATQDDENLMPEVASTRGLERRTEDGKLKLFAAQRYAWNVVLKAQSRQRKTCTYDPDEIARLYNEATSKSLKAAVKRARKDLKESKK